VIKRLKIKFVCINMLIVTLMLTAIFGMVLYMTNHNMRQQSERILQSLHEPPPRGGPGMKEPREPFFSVTVTPMEGYTISENTFFFDKSEEELLEIARKVYEGKEKQGILWEHDLRFSRKNTLQGEQILFLDISTQRNMLQDLYRTCIQIWSISFLVFWFISILLAQWAVRPVEIAWNQQKQFVADASHELKTPLTVIMTNAELLQGTDYTKEEKQQFTGNILSMSRQMRGLVEGLLNLARVDNGTMKTVFQEICFSDIVNECLLPFEPVFFENGMVLDSCVEEGLCVRGSLSHLRQTIEILLDNASKYAPSGSTVRLQLKKQGMFALLTVSNPGPELSREELKNIFRRFYRIDKTRAMNQSYGLGLSIAENIIKEHNGKIWAESRDGMIFFHIQLFLHRRDSTSSQKI